MFEKANQLANIHPPAFTPATGGILQRKCKCGNHTMEGGECNECEKKSGSLQRAPAGQVPVNTVPSIVHEVLRSTGQPLDTATRGFMEPRFGHDLSQVRVHTDARAAESARAVNASAYTVGRNVVFGGGQYLPGTGSGRQLLAHELTHVVQQTGQLQRSSISPPIEIGSEDDELEREADQTAKKVNADENESASGLRRAPAARLQRHVAIVGYDEAGPKASLTGEGKEQELWQCMKANPDVCAPNTPLTWANFQGTPDKSFSAWTVAPVKSGPVPSEVCAQRILGRPANPATRFRTVLDSSKSWVREPFKSANDPLKNGCKPLVDDCKKAFKTPGGIYNGPEVKTAKCAASVVLPSLQAKTVAECDSVLGEGCAKRQLDESARLLDHEVGHFDISCVIAKKANTALDAGGDLGKIETAAEKKRQALYDLYDLETEHSCKVGAQAAWKTDIAMDLKKQNVTLP